MLASQRNAFRIKRVRSEPRGLAPAGSPTPEMVAGSFLNQATAKPYYNIQSSITVSTRSTAKRTFKQNTMYPFTGFVPLAILSPVLLPFL
jgi:hypothetical protein